MSETINPIGKVSLNKTQELNDLLMLLKKEKLSYFKNDIFVDTVLESAVPTNGIKEILGVKIRDIILRGELLNTLQTRNDNTMFNTNNSLLDLEEFNNINLSNEEQHDLKRAIEKQIKFKSETILKDLNELTDNNVQSLEEIINRIKFNFESERMELIKQQNQFIEQQKLYINNLLTLGTKLEELINLKHETVVKRAEEKVDEIGIEIERFYLRSCILNNKLRIAIFEETPISLDGYRKAMHDLNEQQNEYTKEIDRLRTEIENYKNVGGNEEFQEILKMYQQYKRGIENKMWIYNEVVKKKNVT